MLPIVVFKGDRTITDKKSPASILNIPVTAIESVAAAGDVSTDGVSAMAFTASTALTSAAYSVARRAEAKYKASREAVKRPVVASNPTPSANSPARPPAPAVSQFTTSVQTDDATA